MTFDFARRNFTSNFSHRSQLTGRALHTYLNASLCLRRVVSPSQTRVARLGQPRLVQCSS
jgi:hypothetical protein